MNPFAKVIISRAPRINDLALKLTDSRAPDGKGLVARGQETSLLVAIDEVTWKGNQPWPCLLRLTVRVVLNHEIVRHKPVVEDLGAEDVTAHAPGWTVPFSLQELGVW